MLKIRKLGVLKMACFLGLFSFFVGLISAILMWILVSVLSTSVIMTGESQMGLSLASISFSSINFIIFPFAYGVVGFIMGLIFTPIMNLIFKIVKGLDIDIEEPEESSK